MIQTPSNNEYCPNCQASMAPEQQFCGQCGQERLTKTDSLLGVFRHFLGDYFTFDSKIWNSFKPLLFKPGMLTAEYIIGRRARYISPLRLYIFVSILFFLLLAWRSGSTANDAGAASDVLIWNSFFEVYLPRIFFVLLPLFAALTVLLFRKFGLGYVGHLVFALHFHSFVFIVLMIYQLVSRIFAANHLFLVNSILLSIIALWFLIYLAFALKRVFKGRTSGILLRFSILLVIYSALVFTALLSITAFITLSA